MEGAVMPLLSSILAAISIYSHKEEIGMMKKIIHTLLCTAIITTMASGCVNKKQGTEAPETDRASALDTEVAINETQEESPSAKNGIYAIITREEENIYNEIEALSFKEVIEAAGGTCIIKNPESDDPEDQITIINELIDEEVDAIAIAGNDYDALEPALSAAMDAGIKVVSLDSNVNADSRMIFINQTSPQIVGETLMEAVYDISDGEGQWAILSADLKADDQNAWIEVMKEVMEGDKFENLELVEIVYGNDDYVESVKQAQALLQDYPDLKVICAPTTEGIMAAARVVQDQGVAETVKVTGLGIPSEMEEFIGNDDDHSCPYMYLWNPTEIGRLCGYASMALVDGSITGAAGEVFTAGDMGDYTIGEAEDGGTEVVVGPLLKYDSSNIDEWKTVF